MNRLVVFLLSCTLTLGAEKVRILRDDDFIRGEAAQAFGEAESFRQTRINFLERGPRSGDPM